MLRLRLNIFPTSPGSTAHPFPGNSRKAFPNWPWVVPTRNLVGSRVIIAVFSDTYFEKEVRHILRSEWGQESVTDFFFVSCFDQFASLSTEHPHSSVSRQLSLCPRWRRSSQSCIIVVKTVARVRLGAAEVTFNSRAPKLRILTSQFHRAPRTNQDDLRNDLNGPLALPPAPPLDNPWEKVHDTIPSMAGERCDSVPNGPGRPGFCEAGPGLLKFFRI